MLFDRSTLASPKPTGVMPPLPTTANLPVWSASWQVLSPLFEKVSSLTLYCSTVYDYYQLWSGGFNVMTFCSALCKTGLVLIHLARVSGRFWRWTRAAAAPASVKKKPVGHHFKNERSRYNTCYVHIDQLTWIPTCSTHLLRILSPFLLHRLYSSALILWPSFSLSPSRASKDTKTVTETLFIQVSIQWRLTCWSCLLSSSWK